MTNEHPRPRIGKTRKDKANGHQPHTRNAAGCSASRQADMNKKPASRSCDACNCDKSRVRGHLNGRGKTAWVKQQSRTAKENRHD